LCVLLVAVGKCSAIEGIPPKLLQTFLSHLPPQAPIVYLRYTDEITPVKEAVLLGTGLYSSGQNERAFHAAKLYIFVKEEQSKLLFSTDMDERLKAWGLFESGWEIRLRRVVLAHLDQDKQKEIVIFWSSEPYVNISSIQLQTIIHVLDYDVELQRFREVKCAPREEPPGVLRLKAGKVPRKRVHDEEQREQVQSGVQVSGGVGGP